jgi:hypothetical protein
MERRVGRVFVWPTMPSTCQDNGAFMDGPMKEVSTLNKLKHFSGTKKLAKLIARGKKNSSASSSLNFLYSTILEMRDLSRK